jgi:DNA polymerase elongation subunit (family B)
MSYIDAVLEKDHDIIHVVERDENGVRRYVDYPTNYVLYYEDPKGKYRSVFGDSLTKFSTRKHSEFQKEKRILSNKKLFESDVNVVFRCLADNYLDRPSPKLHTVFFDIESDMQPYAYPNSHLVEIQSKTSKKKSKITVHELSHLPNKDDFLVYSQENASWTSIHGCEYLKLGPGFASTSDPFNKVTAITLYLDWLEQLITLCIPPAHISEEKAKELVKDIDNVFIFTDEKDLFETFFLLIEDADVLTGWNSETYDIPYLVNRVTKVMSKNDTRRFCLLDQLPRPKTINKFGKVENVYELVGRVHMDYLQLYKKYNYEQRHSYKLDYIGEMEVGENKTQYEGTLDQLYNRDWRKFIEYNRQDTLLVYKIHAKLKFLDLANQLAHENTVLLKTVMGSVAMIEQAVINEAHQRNLIVQNKSIDYKDDDYDEENDEDDITAAGAFVATPKRGMHEWIAACDINSLYPSVIRSLNMAPETIVGQLRQDLTEKYIEDKKTKLAKEKKNKTAKDITGPILWEGLFGSLEYTAVMNQERDTMITIDWERGGSDTYSAAEIWKMIFDSNQQWVLSANGTIFTYASEGVIPGLLTRWYDERKQVQAKLKKATTTEEKEFLHKRQLVRKILLNSAYGALLNKHCKFYDLRIGQSVTLSGRQIVKHMGSKLNELITGSYDITGDAVIYGDTDSIYYTVWPVIKHTVTENSNEWTKERAIEIYDELANDTNDSFPSFMNKAFHCPQRNGEIIRAGRELVGDRALFITKKRYAVNIYDKEGKRLDLNGKRGEIKAMGLDLKRSDTPKFVQEFLMEVLEEVLAGKEKTFIIEKIKEFKKKLSSMNSWMKGSPKSVNNLTLYADRAKANSKKLNKGLFQSDDSDGDTNMPGHVRASLNWNYLRQINNDNYSMQIVDGMRVVICKLKSNPYNFTSIAYPTDELRLPPWFLSLPFDDTSMETTLVDEKIDNLLAVLDWNLRELTSVDEVMSDLFVFE